tara:strand:- start:5 stop:1012 length:1008 start_codon:yes stop_codon:yes gene_type:complete
MNNIILILVLFFTLSNGLLQNIPIKNNNRNFKNIGKLKTVEPFYEENTDNCVLFFTGASANMPYEIYNSFLSSVASKNITCYVYNNDLENINELSNVLKKKHNNIGLVGHSSGCCTALEFLEKSRNIDNVILFDPVDDRMIKNNRNQVIMNYFLNKNENKFKMPNLNKFIIVKAEKSYKWTFNPFRVPFIPAFDLNKNDFDFSNIFNNNYDEEEYYEYDEEDNDSEDIMIANVQDQIIELRKNVVMKKEIVSKPTQKLIFHIKDYGHCDILDEKWSNIMHNSVSPGYDKRNLKILHNYYDFCSNIVEYSYLKNNTSFKKNINVDTTNIKFNIHKF